MPFIRNAIIRLWFPNCFAKTNDNSQIFSVNLHKKQINLWEFAHERELVEQQLMLIDRLRFSEWELLRTLPDKSSSSYEHNLLDKLSLVATLIKHRRYHRSVPLCTGRRVTYGGSGTGTTVASSPSATPAWLKLLVCLRWRRPRLRFRENAQRVGCPCSSLTAAEQRWYTDRKNSKIPFKNICKYFKMRIIFD